MAIAFGASYAMTPSTSNVSSYTFDSFTPGANRLLIVACYWSRASISVTPTCSGGGLTWSSAQDQLDFHTIASPGKALCWFWAVTGGSPSSMQVNIDFAGQPQTGCNIHVFELTGADTTTPRVQAKTGATDAGTTVSATLDNALASGSATIAIAGNSNNNAMTERTGWTEIADDGYTVPSARLETQYRLATSETTGSADKTGGGAPIAMGIIVVEIAEASSGAQMDGTASLVLTGAAELTTGINMTGTASLAVSTTSALTTEVRLDGVASLVLTGSAELETAVEMAATATLAILGSAGLTTEITLDGTAALAINGTGNLDGAGVVLLDGASSVVLTATADLDTAIQMAGAAALAISAAAALTTEITMTGQATLAILGAVQPDPIAGGTDADYIVNFPRRGRR